MKTKQEQKHTPLDNVCIVQKYGDSDRVLELRKEFEESKQFIEMAVNSHDENVRIIEDCEDEIQVLKETNDELVEALKELVSYEAIIRNQADKAIKKAKQVLKKVGA